MTNGKYQDIDEIEKNYIKLNSLTHTLFHLSTCSLSKNFDGLEYLIKTTNQSLDVIAISESKIKTNMDITTNINLPKYSIEYNKIDSHIG